ncbi:Protein of unknown function [Bacillus mycoides]|nr:Protein of unknown function [Bacillus mycoides]SCB89054.1 Protein of unknown function [Bacillus mycoides]SCM85212.1 Protein of unknown function [Bacillus mycoides]
MFLSEV